MASEAINLQKVVVQEKERGFVLNSIDLFRKPLMQLGNSLADIKEQIVHPETLTVIPEHLETDLADIKKGLLPYLESELLYKLNLLPGSKQRSCGLASHKGVLLLAESFVMVFDLPEKTRPSDVVGEIFIALPKLFVMVLTVTSGKDDAHDVAAYNASVTRDLTDSLTRFMDESVQLVSGTMQMESLKDEDYFAGRMRKLAEKACSVVTLDSLYVDTKKYSKVMTAVCASIAETKSILSGSGKTLDCLRFLSKDQCVSLLQNLNRTEVHIRGISGAGSTTLMVEMARRLSKVGKTLLVCGSSSDKEQIRPVFESTITGEEYEPALLEKYHHIIHDTDIAPIHQKGRRWTFSRVSGEAIIEEELSLLDLKEKFADLTKENADLIQKMEELKIQLREATGSKLEKKQQEYEMETGKMKKEEMKDSPIEKSDDAVKEEGDGVKGATSDEDTEETRKKSQFSEEKALEIKPAEDIEETEPEPNPGISTPAVFGGDVTRKTLDQIYHCPLCPKVYKSKSGFRNHVVQKHNRPDLREVAVTKHSPEVMVIPQDPIDLPEVPDLLEAPNLPEEEPTDDDITMRPIKKEPREIPEASQASAGVLSFSDDDNEDKKLVLLTPVDGEDNPTRAKGEGVSYEGRVMNHQCPLCPKVYKSEAGYKNHVRKIHKRPDLIDIVLKKRHIVDVTEPSDVQPAKRMMTEDASFDILDVIVKGPLLEYNTIKVNTIYCHVTAEKHLVNWPPDTRDEDSRKFIRYRGTCSFLSIPLPVDPVLSLLNYWETETDVKLLKAAEWPLLEVGVSEESQVDTNNWIWLQSRSWCVRVGDCPTHTTGICTQVWGNKEHVLCKTGTMSADSGTETVLRFGVVLDTGKGRLAFLDLNNSICLHKFDVDFQEAVFPMFGVWPVPDWFTLRMRLISGTDITITEGKKDLIQSALTD